MEEKPTEDEASASASDEMEGQEMILVEEEVSVKKEVAKGTLGAEKKKKTKKKKKRRSLFRKPQTTDKEGEQESSALATKSRVVVLDSVNQEAAQKASFSRRLLEAALRQYDQTNLRIDESARGQVAHVAFQQAAEARRLVEGDDDEKDLETVISENASKGEAAAAKVRSILAANNTPTNDIEECADDVNVQQEEEAGMDAGNDGVEVRKETAWPTRYTPQDIFDEAEVHAATARQHLEAILPILDCVPDDHRSIQAHPLVPTAGIDTNGDQFTLSTLGFDNTFQETLLSITSLNEILDAPLSPLNSEVGPSNTTPTEEEKGTSHKGRFSWFGRKPHLPESKSKDRSGLQEEQGIPEPTTTAAAGAAMAESSNNSVEEDRPVERFIASVVKEEDAESVRSDISNRSELERLKELDERTDSKIKEAMEFDRSGSLTSWYGVPLFDKPPDPTTQTRAEAKSGEGENKSELFSAQVSPRNTKELKPQFVGAPEYDPKVLQSQSWDHLLVKEQESEKEHTEVPDSSAKKKKWGLLKRRKQKSDNHASKDETNVSIENETNDLERKQNGNPASTNAGNPPGDDDVCTEVNELKSSSILSKEEVGDRYTVISEDDDSFHETVTQRVSDKTPLVTDVDMMPDQPEPVDVRLVTSLDAEQRGSNDSDNVKFVDVEIGTDQVEKKIMSRETVIEKINTPRKPKEPAEKLSTVERVRTLPDKEGMSSIEPSTSMIEVIDKQKMEKKNDEKKVGKQDKHSKRSWRVFGKGRSNKNKSKTTEISDESDPPDMCRVTPVNTGSSSDCPLENQN